jgi:hypothetical protein
MKLSNPVKLLIISAAITAIGFTILVMVPYNKKVQI